MRLPRLLEVSAQAGFQRGQQSRRCYMRSGTCCTLGLLNWVKGDKVACLLDVGGAAGHKSKLYGFWC